MLREYVIGEAMHALGIPTTRALAVVATGEEVVRETVLPGAVLTRVAASHIRVGTFQYAAISGGPELVQRLADYAIARHHPAAAESEHPYRAFFESVLDAQAALIARWMGVGFIHGVMNTDNMAISGETIDYGPCAFMDAYDPATVFSSIDHRGRYAYANQPPIAQWNLARLAEALLPLFDADPDGAMAAGTALLQSFPDRYEAYRRAVMRAKLGLTEPQADDVELFEGLLALMQAQRVDFTSCFRALSASLRGDDERARALFAEPAAFDAWSELWHARLAASAADDREATADAMDRVNPVYVPRNHLVEDALAAATEGDVKPFERLVDVLADPFGERAGLEIYAAPAPAELRRLLPDVLRHVAAASARGEPGDELRRLERDVELRAVADAVELDPVGVREPVLPETDRRRRPRQQPVVGPPDDPQRARDVRRNERIAVAYRLPDERARPRARRDPDDVVDEQIGRDVLEVRRDELRRLTPAGVGRDDRPGVRRDAPSSPPAASRRSRPSSCRSRRPSPSRRPGRTPRRSPRARGRRVAARRSHRASCRRRARSRSPPRPSRARRRRRRGRSSPCP